ncbi:hypothetical protein [Modicisalibacter coralii]|uniref:hypothetical protein n=1 Tax=Modicisalibacter coralii TaxID=2304602 RepID=UPI0013968EA6|nr:hypothetical protein [Halomonas coralii]
MPEQDVALDARTAERLAKYARQHGITQEQAIQELVSGELRSRTKPRACKGTVQPFRRR